MADPKKPGRILALDVGSRRIGLAVTDELGITAQGLRTLERAGKRRDLATLKKIARKYGVAEIVVGHPLHMSGEPSAQSERVEQFAGLLREGLQLPVHLLDERLTSWQAQEILAAQGRSPRDRPGAVDQMAATLILESFLQAHPSRTGRKAGS